MLWGGHGWDNKKNNNNIYSSWIKSGVLLNSGACTWQWQGSLTDGSSCVMYRIKPFPRSQWSKEWCFVSIPLIPSAGVGTVTRYCHPAQTDTRNGSFLPLSSVQLWTSSKYRNTRMRIACIFKHIETYRAIYVLFKYEYTFPLPFRSAVAHTADLHLAHPAVTHWNSSSGDHFAPRFGGRRVLPPSPPEPQRHQDEASWGQSPAWKAYKAAFVSSPEWI